MASSAPADPTVKQRKLYAKMGWAMPDGSYYIRNGPIGAGDLQNAILAVGRGENAGDSGAAIRKHIMDRAKALGLSSKIPATWNADGTLKTDAEHSAMVDGFLEHFGVKGMRWGVRKDTSTSSDDASRAKDLGAIAKKHGSSALSNDELRDLVNRLNLEAQYSKLDPKSKAGGEKFLTDLLANVAKQQATSYANKYAAQGIDQLISNATKAHASS